MFDIVTLNSMLDILLANVLSFQSRGLTERKCFSNIFLLKFENFGGWLFVFACKIKA